MHFVDQINFVASLRRRVSNILAELADIFDTVVAGAVDLDHVETIAGSNLQAVMAFATWGDGRSFHAIERLRETPRG